MYIRGNHNSLFAWRALTDANGKVERSIKRLSSGQRINAAADDAAGLGITQRIRTLYRGVVQANRNALDGVSLVNTAEAALDEVNVLLRRGLELSVAAANGVLEDNQRESLQQEMDHILAEIDRIVDSASFNGVQLLNTHANGAAIAKTVQGLRSGWLEEAANVIQTYYGLTGDGSNLTIILENDGPSPTWVTGTPGAFGRLTNIAIHVNVSDFGAVGGPDGGLGPIYNDRKVARALAEAIIGRNSNFASLPKWFTSGVGEYIAGRDEQLLADINQYGTAAVINAITSPNADGLQRSASYLAMKYLDYRLGLAGRTMQDFMTALSSSLSLNVALMTTIGVANATVFRVQFQANAAAFLGTLNLTDNDVGGINPGDASGVIPNGGTYAENPLAPAFDLKVTTAGGAGESVITLQVGPNVDDEIEVVLPQISTFNLGLLGLDLVDKATEAITLVQQAIGKVSTARSQLGSVSNRLEHTLAVNGHMAEAQQSSASRIADLDFAFETTSLARDQILVSSASMVLSQANTMRQHVMWLLRGL